MKVTITRDSATVGVDGVFRVVDVSDLDSTIHAITFDTVAVSGSIKYGEIKGWANTFITSFSSYQIYVDRWTAAAPVAPSLASTAVSTVTVGASPFVWQNTSGSPITLVLSGGNVSLIEMSRDNSTYYGIGLIAGAIRVAAGDYIRVTYLVAPTIKLFP